MKTLLSLSFAIAIAATPLSGELHPAPPVNPSTCPVGLQVELDNRLAMYKDAHSDSTEAKAQHPSTRFDFKVQNPSPRKIVSMRVTARGFSAKWRFFTASEPSPDLAKTVDVPVNVKGNGDAMREVVLSGFPSVRTFDVIAVTYADGSTWRAQTAEACRFAPSPVVLIGAR